MEGPRESPVVILVDTEVTVRQYPLHVMMIIVVAAVDALPGAEATIQVIQETAHTRVPGRLMVHPAIAARKVMEASEAIARLRAVRAPVAVEAIVAEEAVAVAEAIAAEAAEVPVLLAEAVIVVAASVDVGIDLKENNCLTI